ncbi:DUF2252 family protein [Aureivirga sp. CE67]|uniref:DUF2252 family protein n=1 Tax=Aureivirga sp. CE67 TaxID=1788983 RepID=UPI0018CAE1F1|nr:DUF2252 family protein [Aureivirga sp. CE67]
MKHQLIEINNQSDLNIKKQHTLTLHNRIHKILHEIREQNDTISFDSKMKKYFKMAQNPYAFYRGSNHLYWEDFFNDWRFRFFGGRPETLTWVQGDAHIYNFGAFSNHQGEVIYGLNDFDDSIVADYQYDLWRMAISIVLDARVNGYFDFKQQKRALDSFVEAYLEKITFFSERENWTEWHYTKKTTDGKLKKFLKKVEKKKSRLKMLDKWTIGEGTERKFNTELEKLSEISTDMKLKIQESFVDYCKLFSLKNEQFKILDIAERQGAGTGSLGTKRFYVLIEGDEETNNLPIILDVKKQQTPPACAKMNQEEIEEYNNTFQHEGERHLLAFKAIAEHPDLYLGWLDFEGEIYSVRERSPFKEAFPTEKLKDEDDFYMISKQWGKILATEHQRAAYALHENYDSFIFSKYLVSKINAEKEKFLFTVREIAFNYADCVQDDWKSFVNALNLEISKQEETI